ncbi:MAG: LysM domain-containing protein [Actinomycetota bacterium]
MLDRLPQRLILGIAGLMLVAAVAGCGRSAPEGATGTPVDGPEPAAAGIRAVSEATVVPPAPTTITTVPTTAAPTTTAPTAAAPAGTYVIEPGDTLSVIAEQFGVSVEALSEANGITDVNSIRPGQELIIPAAGG